ncbi:NUDIX hydrolase [Candidatus Parcubacteria bacterium]|nr:NUDIX hydrolase [Candidatus Parcubacteria bacterium]
MKVSISVRGIIIHEGKLLVAKQKVDDDFWCLPGGRLESGESLEEAMKRELFEETAVQPRVGKLLFIHQLLDEKQPVLEFFYSIENGDGYASFDTEKASHAHENSEFKFVAPNNHSYNILPAFLQSEVPRLIEVGAGNFEVKSFVSVPKS